MELGDTFLLPDPGEKLDPHLWIVLSHPRHQDGRVLIVNFTTYRENRSETACIVESNEHVWLTHRSVVNYADAKLVAVSVLMQLTDQGAIEPREPLSDELLDRVLEGAARSARIPLEYAQLLIDQGLIEA